jgi:hypothetical protein
MGLTSVQKHQDPAERKVFLPWAPFSEATQGLTSGVRIRDSIFRSVYRLILRHFTALELRRIAVVLLSVALLTGHSVSRLRISRNAAKTRNFNHENNLFCKPLRSLLKNDVLFEGETMNAQARVNHPVYPNKP